MSEAEVAKAAASKAPGRAVRIALAVSVALNLAVLGVAAGAALKHGGSGRAVERDIGFGPFSEALSREDRRALRGKILQRAPELRSVRKDMQADTQSLLAVLRAEPFDAAGLAVVMETQRARMAGRLDVGQAVLRDFLIAMTPEARKAFADRLEARLMAGGKP
ncbi:MAG: hypothetical protein FD162_2345 [Rhodobacteraceae bacterium]|uniref:periplasmic heavy metal sensor n=1 Tax=Cypionkella sp. TaxID=2811411 RepID=UPI001321CCFC|nr:periplasmic heavy metal sensor [Cypionkella sp.]KAF0172513.1 MAG: hypothetical protein FD162_2345 [Paracoccaceae bacterium]MDO8325634.1 periplasmic heavy metal sensor [Cypionkella sp.]